MLRTNNDADDDDDDTTRPTQQPSHRHVSADSSSKQSFVLDQLQQLHLPEAKVRRTVTQGGKEATTEGPRETFP
ncbi:MAG: hypothetical protein M1815_005792 [Lichina confinis]|nr:MAG: hypothetical protein M1815_005792 [Lichina confinis]